MTFNGNSRSKLVVHYSSSDISKKNNENKDDLALSTVEADMVIHGAGREPSSR